MDWAQAFDSVTFSAVNSSLQYMGVPNLLTEAISSLYRIKTLLLLARIARLPPFAVRKPAASSKGALFPHTCLVSFSPTSLRMLSTSMKRLTASFRGHSAQLGTLHWDLKWMTPHFFVYIGISSPTPSPSCSEKRARRGLHLNYDKCDSIFAKNPSTELILTLLSPSSSGRPPSPAAGRNEICKGIPTLQQSQECFYSSFPRRGSL